PARTAAARFTVGVGRSRRPRTDGGAAVVPLRAKTPRSSLDGDIPRGKVGQKAMRRQVKVNRRQAGIAVVDRPEIGPLFIESAPRVRPNDLVHVAVTHQLI